MFVIVGIVVVLGSVVVGFMMAGGELAVLVQIAEFVIIGGAVIGSIFVSLPLNSLKKMGAMVPKVVTHKVNTKDDYLGLLKSFYELFVLAQRNGLLSLEKHVENPEASEIFSKNPKFLANQPAVAFVCDTLKVMLSGGIPPHEIDELMETEIHTYEQEYKPLTTVLAKTAESLPGLGIVAAVLGIIVTMGSIDAGAAEVGHHVAAALVGTFLGVLLCYGIVGPMATNLEMMVGGEAQFLETIKACIVSYAKGNPPIIAVEIARRTIISDARPTFTELEGHLRGR